MSVVRQIYPNPAFENVNIALPSMAISEMKLIDIMGKTCLEWTFSKGNSIPNFSFSTMELNAGMYLLEITSEEGLKSAKRLKIMR